MADFADFCMKIACSWGIENEVKTVLMKLQYEQAQFTMEADPTRKLLCLWASENPDREVDATTLNNQLALLAKQEGISYPYAEMTKSFAQRLRYLPQELEGMIEITSRPAHGGIKRYRLMPRWAKKPGGEDGGEGGK
jgi:hypothetical protein